MEVDIKAVHAHLKTYGIRPLPNVVAIMKYLLENFTHPTIDQIYNDLLPLMPTLSKTTVYNALKLFCDKKAVTALYIDDRNVRFEAHNNVHAHFRCRKCNAIHDIPLEPTDFPPFKGSQDLHPDETHVYFLGKCKKCG